jgi:hypothetical protein
VHEVIGSAIEGAKCIGALSAFCHILPIPSYPCAERFGFSELWKLKTTNTLATLAFAVCLSLKRQKRFAFSTIFALWVWVCRTFEIEDVCGLLRLVPF